MDKVYSLGLDSLTSRPSPSDVLQVVLSSIADFQSSENCSIPENQSTRSLEAENGVDESEIVAMDIRSRQTLEFGEIDDTAGNDESVIVAMEIRSGQTSEFGEIDNIFGLFKNLHQLGALREEQ